MSLEIQGNPKYLKSEDSKDKLKENQEEHISNFILKENSTQRLPHLLSRHVLSSHSLPNPSADLVFT